MKKILLSLLMLLGIANGAASAQTYSGQSSNIAVCCSTVSVITNCTGQSVINCEGTTSCCEVTDKDDSIAAWAAAKAVTHQLDWFDAKAVEKLDRVDLDALQERVDEICKWATTLSNHIFGKAYADWGGKAKQIIVLRRKTLDQQDVAMSLVTGLPTPPTK